MKITGFALPVFVAAIALALSGCSDSQDSMPVQPEKNSPGLQKPLPVKIKVAPRSVTRKCFNWSQGQTVRYQINASDTIHVGVSVGQSLKTQNPVALHLARSEARKFSIRETAEHCIHFDNRNSSTVLLDLSIDETDPTH